MNRQTSRYFRGILWFVASLLCCVTNDSIMKHIGLKCHPLQIVFMRFFFGVITLLPFVLKNQLKSLKTTRPLAHIVRGLILFSGITLWCSGLKSVPLNVASLITFTIPMFTLLLAAIMLQENIGRARWLATLCGFIGVGIVINPEASNFPLSGTLILLFGASMFALLDIINKMLSSRESTISSIFYTAFITMTLSSIPAIILWQPLSIYQLCLFFILGMSSNFLLFCVLKSFSYVDVSAVAPFRYFELIFAYLFGYVLFGEVITIKTLLGGAIIIPSALYLMVREVSFGAKKICNKKGISCCQSV
ncbi:MAG: DMT family transporter [Puniceicoccales bacterium]|nr:DMT family transporter [Puniceicoccales bacterium]